jgi:uncharacterized protein (TIGR02453 family)
MGEPSFTAELFGFLDDLAANNDRTWFKANRQRYEDAVLEPALAFVAAFAGQLAPISRHYVAEARPVGGSLFRLQRDTRFSKDKTPYKTNLGISFRHQRRTDAHTPAFYLHLQPGNVFAAAGMWHPERTALARVRDAIVARPERWLRAAHGEPFAAAYRLGGESLLRPPRGYDPASPLLDDLKRKDFFGVAELPEEVVLAPDFLDEYAHLCRVAAPFMRFLCDAVNVPF